MNLPGKIKIYCCIPTLQCGGSEKYISTICRHLDKNIFAVTLIVLDNRDPFYSPGETVTLIDLKTPRARNAIWKIEKIVKKDPPDILFSAANHLNILLAMLRGRFPGKMLLIARESSLVSANTLYAPRPVLFNALAKRFYKKVDHVICQSAAMQNDLVSSYHMPLNKTTVLFNPVDDPGVAQQSFIPHKFITVARLSPEKGIDRLIRSVAALTIPFRYHIIGNGAEKDKLEALVKTLHLQDKIIFHGTRRNPFNGMEDAQFFLMGSFHEGFPNAVLEAVALGIPVIAFNVPGGTGEIIDEHNGVLVNGGIAAFTAALEQASLQNFNRQSIQTVTLTRFSMDNHLHTLEHLLLEIMQNN